MRVSACSQAFACLCIIIFISIQSAYASVHTRPRPSSPFRGWKAGTKPCQGQFAQLPFCNTSLSIGDRVADVLSRLSIADKASLMDNAAAGVDSVGLPPYEWWSEALHGVNSNCDPNSGRCPSSFPAALNSGATFNKNLFATLGQIISDEARALHSAGATTFLNHPFGLDVWAPNINIFRDPRWGRGQETPGEDPYLSGVYGSLFTYNLEGAGKEKWLKLVATMKHFAAYSLENWEGMDRFHFNAIVSAQDLNQTYFPAFQTTTVQGKLHGLMCSYNAVNGVPSCANDFLANELRNQWGFDGYVTSDCGAIECIWNTHNYTSTLESAVATAIAAGTDLDCSNVYAPNIPKAVSDGLLTEAQVDLSLSRLFTLQMRLGMFDVNETNPYDQIPITVVDSDDHRAFALQVAKESLVLLKNDPLSTGSPLLPLKPTMNIALLGPNANVTDTLASNYYGQLPHMVSLLEGIGNMVQGKLTYVKGCNISDQDTSHFDEAVAAAKASDAAVVVLGIDQSIESEGLDRVSIDLPGVQLQFLKAVLAVQPNTVLVLINGGPVDITWAKGNVPSILEAFYPGEEGGNAVASVLFGEYSPSGRLPITIYPGDYVNQIPLTSMDMREGPGKTYRFFNNSVYPFGYGLSYTSFAYSTDFLTAPLASTAITQEPAGDKAIVPTYDALDHISINITVTNTGSVESDVSVLAYVAFTGSDGDCPVKQLCGFEKISNLAAGNSQSIQIGVSAECALCVNSAGRKVIKPGVYRVTIEDTVTHFAVSTRSGRELEL